jgi:hypothetical protein
MQLRTDFQFSQNNLQDYVDCPRRFELLHIDRILWPALECEPVIERERRLEQGNLFHRLVHQHLSGIPEDLVAGQASSADLCRWWQNYMRADPLAGLPAQRLVEFALSAPFAGYRLVAKYDLLAFQPGKNAVIVDWKTSQNRLPASYLKNRLQTRIYPFLLVEAGACLNGFTPLEPGQIEMVYWFTEYPDQPERLTYSEKQFENDRQFLHGLVSEISKTARGEFILTVEEKRCVYCRYRSLCVRGIRAGSLSGMLGEEDRIPAAEINFEQIGELEF